MTLASQTIESVPGDIPVLVAAQRKFFSQGRTQDLEFRLRTLRAFREMLLNHEKEIYEALRQDLRKSDFESYVSELGMVLEEAKSFLKHLKKWSAPRKVGVPLSLMPGSAKVYPEPYGLVLVLSPWNYPIQLSLTPSLGALGAGNCVILKPSELAPASSALMRKMVAATFPREHFAVVEGGPETTQALLKEKMDYIFFTGSTRVGRIVMEAAAKHLTPLTLELGGKSPCIVDETADLKVAAKRIVWGKFFNAGQTCVAPDYLLVSPKIREPLLEKMKAAIRSFYTEDHKQSPDYCRIINRQHFDRLSQYLRDGRIVSGGESDPASLYLAPTILTDVAENSRIMQEEIFGPILPVLTYENLDEAVAFVRKHPKPLSLYLFTTDSDHEKKILQELSFGGGCVNETLTHLAVPDMPFGGVGNSGFGSYHGKSSFDTFTHAKGVLKKPNFLDLKIKYPPYKGRLGLAKKLIG
jgi:aldehyde dehydrogenase (NAD+)